MSPRPASETAWISGREIRMPDRTVLDSSDVDEVQEVMASLLADNSVTLNESPGDFRLVVREFVIGDLWLAHLRTGSGITIHSQPLDCYAFDLTLRGRTDIRHGATVAAANPHEATMLSPISSTALSWDRQTEVLCLRVPRPALEQHFRKLGGTSGPILFDTGVDARTGPWLRAVIGQALSTFAGSAGMALDALSGQLRDSILTAMLLELSHDRRQLLLERHRAEESRLCDAATAIMLGELAKPPPIPAIARRLCVSERALQMSFREHLGTTPSARFKQLRLEAVRNALLEGDPKRDTVTRLAVDVGGFAHPGRFSHEYFQTFGEHPSETLRRQCDGTAERTQPIERVVMPPS